ncbi:MAG TPA: hypothetical protein DET40_17585 [Lentisphaeria bacterium]|nr:MAG: hypothetical protein A2X45_02420 [Lentisphaerae bacterium GWF2_50_93]HCE45355.1 hypothetical protein [Lentisphaeria bacterium]
MLQTIEIQIDDIGKFHTLEPLTFKPTGRALLTLLENPDASAHHLHGTAKQALVLLSSARFSKRPVASPEEVSTRISNMRNE